LPSTTLFRSNPSGLLGSRAMADVVAELESRYDVVLLDCAPLLPVTDATILSKTADGILLVAGGGIVTKDELTEATGKLATVGATVLGVVLNRVERKSGSRTYGYHPHSVDLEPESVPPRRPGHRESGRETEALPRDTEGDGTEDGRPAPSAARSPAPGRPAPAAPRPSRHRKRHRPRALREAVRRTADGTALDRFAPDEASTRPRAPSP